MARCSASVAVLPDTTIKAEPSFYPLHNSQDEKRQREKQQHHRIGVGVALLGKNRHNNQEDGDGKQPERIQKPKSQIFA